MRSAVFSPPDCVQRKPRILRDTFLASPSRAGTVCSVNTFCPARRPAATRQVIEWPALPGVPFVRRARGHAAARHGKHLVAALVTHGWGANVRQLRSPGGMWGGSSAATRATPHGGLDDDEAVRGGRRGLSHLPPLP
jgi:hypothetical protein